jgi:predicted NUDIX family NTP pyrophosphohydrolase
MIWPPNSGQAQTFPEVDRAEWFNQDAALRNVVLGQAQAITDCFARLDEMARDGRRRSKLTQIPIK